jgi:hypothetical protein
MDSRHGSLIRRASSNTTISSISPSQVYTDGDPTLASDTPQKRKKFGKLFNVTITKHPSNSKSSILSTTPSQASKSALLNSNKTNNDSNTSINSTNGPTTPNQRKNHRHPQDQNVNNTARPPSTQLIIKPDRRKDIKLTHCQEKDGVWTATGQFGRESRHSKRAEISYDKKKFRFMQKDDQGNKHVFEIPVSDIESN